MNPNIDITPPADPWPLFKAWLVEAELHEVNDFNAMSVATVGADGMPSLRMVLLKEWDDRGFVFYTNRLSRKGEQLAARPRLAMCMHWKSIRRQVRAEGMIDQTTEAESDAYHASRPRGSQIGAWASLQSQPLDSRATLEARVRELEKKYQDRDVPRPPHWGGYRLVPNRVEFWQDRPYRLHDRFIYTRGSSDLPWQIERQYP